MAQVEQARLVMLMQYVEAHQQPPERGVTLGALSHAGYSREEVQTAVDQGYIERMSGPRQEYVVSGYTHGSL